ncbi:MAG TPA: hypothetical protein VFQ39_02570 [Longimicrobium sp.]|nr:hypothetical protein [Longimicrobium sp.]
MKKLRLDMEDLRVESFQTAGGAGLSRGTVRGHATLRHCTEFVDCTIDFGCGTVGCGTGAASCNGTCDASCNGSCASCVATCGASCNGTCDATCASCGYSCYDTDCCVSIQASACGGVICP